MVTSEVIHDISTHIANLSNYHLLLMVKKIYFIRHANAEELERGGRDIDRPLSREGYRHAALVGQRLAQLNVKPDLFLTSPAVRTLQTSEIIADQIKFESTRVVVDDEVYEGSARVLLRIINGIDEKYNTVLLVAHNPGITFIAEYLTGGQIGNMEPAGMAEVAFEGLQWSEISQNTCQLERYIAPENLH